MKSSRYWLLGFLAGIIILIVFAFKFLYNPICYDGYGSARYVDKTELLSKLNSITTKKGVYWDNLNITSNAMESFRCGDTTYSIKEGEKWKEVSKSKFDIFIEQNKENKLRVHQSGNSPFFVDDLTDGKKYFIGINESRYVLMSSS